MHKHSVIQSPKTVVALISEIKVSHIMGAERTEKVESTGSAPSFYVRMEDEECNLLIELRQRVVQKFSDFMTRVAEFEELVAVGNRLLIGFQQGLVHTCQLGLQDHLSKAKCILSEMERLMDDVVGGMQSTNENISDLQDRYFDKLDQQEPAYEKEEVAPTHASHLHKHEATDYAAMMAIIFSMVKQDYMMQERIVSSLNLKSSTGELDSYCLMWSLRPFINDEMMHQAWKLLP